MGLETRVAFLATTVQQQTGPPLPPSWHRSVKVMVMKGSVEFDVKLTQILRTLLLEAISILTCLMMFYDDYDNVDANEIQKPRTLLLEAISILTYLNSALIQDKIKFHFRCLIPVMIKLYNIVLSQE